MKGFGRYMSVSEWEDRTHGLHLRGIRSVWALAGLVCGLGVYAPTAHGQRWQLDLNAARVAADTTADVASASMAPAVEWRSRTAYGLLGGALTGFEGSTWAAQARAELSLLAEPFGLLHPVRVELVGIGQGSYHSSEFRTAMSRAEGRMHVAGERLGGWVA